MTDQSAIDNATSIADIPSQDFPDTSAKFHLMLRALNGEDIYAYHPACSNQWVLWIRGEDPAHDDRYSIDEYCDKFNKEREAIA